MRILAAPDKFKGTASAAEVAAAVARVGSALGHDVDECPLSDGGDGLLEALGGEPRWAEVSGPLGMPARTEWRILGEVAVVETALASGLVVAGGPSRRAALESTTTGTGQLIVEADRAGARRILVGLGGSSSTDGGLGAVEAVDAAGGLTPGTELIGLYDVAVPFLQAAAMFGPQKGARPEDIAMLEERLRSVAAHYAATGRADVLTAAGAGAAGGLGGGILALGGRLEAGFGFIAHRAGLEERMARSGLIVTGEGRLDSGSFEGKVVGSIARLAAARRVAVLVVVGVDATGGPPPPGLSVISLEHDYGPERSRTDTTSCVEEAVAAFLSGASATT